jgi:hypothetical protein
VIGRFPGETSALSLIWAVLELSSRGWRGVVMTPRNVAEIERLRRRQPQVSTQDEIAPSIYHERKLRPRFTRTSGRDPRSSC